MEARPEKPTERVGRHAAGNGHDGRDRSSTAAGHAARPGQRGGAADVRVSPLTPVEDEGLAPDAVPPGADEARTEGTTSTARNDEARKAEDGAGGKAKGRRKGAKTPKAGDGRAKGDGKASRSAKAGDGRAKGDGKASKSAKAGDGKASKSAEAGSKASKSAKAGGGKASKS
ncbi:MAG TPA: hypothetical protein VFZ77_03790, partial [Acidimicrobiales bacterium]